MASIVIVAPCGAKLGAARDWLVTGGIEDPTQEQFAGTDTEARRQYGAAWNGGHGPR